MSLGHRHPEVSLGHVSGEADQPWHEASSVRGAASSSVPVPKRAQPPSDESFHCDAELGDVLEPVLSRYWAGEGKGVGEPAGACPAGCRAGARGAAG